MTRWTHLGGFLRIPRDGSTSIEKAQNEIAEKTLHKRMTHRQLTAVCIALGFKHLFEGPYPFSLPSEPSPVAADSKAEKAAVSRVAEGDGAKRNLPLTLKAAFGAISRKGRGTSAEG